MFKDYACVTRDSNLEILEVLRLVVPNLVPKFHIILGRGRSGFEINAVR